MSLVGPAAAGAGPGMELGEAGSAYGSVVVDGIRKSLRLNPTLREAVVKNADAVNEAATRINVPEEALAYLPIDLAAPAPAGGRRRRMRGGALTPEEKQSIAALTTAALITMAAGYFAGTQNLVAGAGATGAATAALVKLVGTERAGAAGRAIGKYLESRGAGRIGESVGTLGTAVISTLDRTLAFSFAALRFPIAGGTAVIGTLGRLVDRGAVAIQQAADKLESPRTHEEQADLIIENGTLAFATALAALTASGALPLMTIFSVMLWTGKLYTSPLGRALGVVELYVWWINRTDAQKKEVEAEVKAYVDAAKKGSQSARAWVDSTGAPKMKEAFEWVAPKIKKSAEGFVEGLKEGSAMENPVAAALSLAFVRAAGLGLDEKAPPPKPEEDEGGALEKLAVNIVKDAFSASPAGVSIDAAKLRNVIDRLRTLRSAEAEVAALREQLQGAKAVRAKALAAVAPGAVPARALGPVGAPVGAPVAAPPPEPEPAPVPAPRRRRAAEEPPVEVAAEPPVRRSRRAAAAAVGATGGRRKTRRKRLVRRKTKKTLATGFYY